MNQQYFSQSLRHFALYPNEPQQNLYFQNKQIKIQHPVCMQKQTYKKLKFNNYPNQESFNQARLYSSQLRRCHTCHQNELADSAIRYLETSNCRKKLDRIDNRTQSRSVYIEKRKHDPYCSQKKCVKDFVKQQIQMNQHWLKVQKMIQNIPIRLKQSIEKEMQVDYIQCLSQNTAIGYNLDQYSFMTDLIEDIVLKQIELFLKNCQNNLTLLMTSYKVILKRLLCQSNLSSLFGNPIVMAQVESHWKIMATKFKIRYGINVKNKYLLHVWSQLEQFGHFLDRQDENSDLIKFIMDN